MELSLRAGDLLRLKGNRKGFVLHCLKGTIWLTKGDEVDYLVYPGKGYELKAGETAVVEALGGAEVRLEAYARERGGSAPILVLNAAGL
jgi:hypothetical protein